MNTEEQIRLINNTISKTKESIRPLGFNFIFWGFLIIIMSLIHFLFPEVIQYFENSAFLYWTIFPLLGVCYTSYYNFRASKKVGYETYLGRAIKILWGVFIFSWCILMVTSFVSQSGAYSMIQNVIILLGGAVLATGLIIRSKPVALGGVSVFILYILTYIITDLNIFIFNILALVFGCLIPGFSLYYNKKNE
ncbi:MAG: hypothetical protein CMC79_04390 [Flavobacteriaceae bacterium]|nr:hypothetical protein [Flavobacteriaceae bacterium]|tara:strand:+ start:22944 stop:23522 length:579 start_codon:yes stop_codon:yes gene_type:complete